MPLYKMVELTEGTPVQYVGVYILKWQSRWGEPEVGFVEVDEDEQAELAVGMMEVKDD